MKVKEKKKGEIKPRKLVFYGLISALAVIVVLGLSATAYAYAYRDKALLNSYLLGKNISSYSPQKLSDFINRADSQYPEKRIKVVYKEKNWEINYSDFEWSLHKDQTNELIIGRSHRGSIGQRILALSKSIVLKQKYDLVYTFNEDLLQSWIDKINLEVGHSKQETNIVIKDGNVKITDSASGEKIDDGLLKKQIIERLKLKEKGEIRLTLIKDDPIITKEEAQKLVEKAKELTNRDVKLTGPKGAVSIGRSDLGTLIKLKKKIIKKTFLRSELGDAYVSFDDAKIKDSLQRNLDTLNISAIDAQFSIAGGAVNLIAPSKSGQEIKLDESVSAIVAGLEKGKSEITLPSKVQDPSISAQTSEDIQKIGLKELIGTATTSFARSPQNRIHNIRTGVKYISGSIIKPGEEFSTIRRLGKIDQSSGYLPELVIKENATVPEYGGGLCQVSTTLFRAAMNSGLKITERQNHSYRVSYYEPPVGMDATIYYPKPDFKFINTTDHYIFVSGRVEGTKITFDIYGTKDGRTVEVTNPSVYDVTSPPEPIYTDDPSLAPGELKQTDHAHPGAKATFNYTVKKDGKVINQQTFNSAYVAWPAKFLRGPGVKPSESQPESTPSSTPTASVSSPPSP